MRFTNDGNRDIAGFHPRKKTTKFRQEDMAAGGTFPLPPVDEALELLSAHFQHEKRMPVAVKTETGCTPRKKSAHWARC